MGHGFKLSPVVVVTKLILDGAARTVDISTLRMSRLAEGDLNTSTYSFRVIV